MASRAEVHAQKPNSPDDVLIDLGHPLVNRVVDGFIKAGGVGAIQAGAQDAVRSLFSEESDQRSLEHAAQRMGKEALQWGLVAGMYTGITYATKEARGVHDWKNALLGGALTGAALSLTEPNPRTDHIISGAITGGAIATAAEFLRNLTY
ncbi:unnamed protein product [Sphagnum compactum]